VLPALAASLLAYFIGSISAAILVCRALGLPDPRTDGSGNPGATNVLRIGGKKPAAMTLAGDLFKGLIPVAIANTLSDNTALIALVGLGALLGHLYPIFFNFEGGKGVATAFGVAFGLNPFAGVVAALLWGASAFAFKRSSLAALIAFSLLPLYWFWNQAPSYAVLSVMIAGLLYYTHRGNIKRLIDGTEPKIGKR